MDDDSPDDVSGIMSNEYDVLSGGVLQVCLGGDEDAYILVMPRCQFNDTSGQRSHLCQFAWPIAKPQFT